MAANELPWRLHLQPLVRVIFIVILEPLIKLCHDRFCIGSIMNINIIPLEGFDEGLGHAVGFRASYRGKTTDEAHILAKEMVSVAV